MTQTDQLGRSVEVSFPLTRIISLVPSQTELLYDLGLENEVAGITKFCVHPPKWHRTKPRVGGTKKIDLKKIDSLNPGLIIGNKEENEKAQIQALEKKYPVWMSDVKDLKTAVDMICSVGAMTGKKEKAQNLSKEILCRFHDLKNYVATNNFLQKKAAYLIWQKPMMAAGGQTFINEMLHACNLKNIFEDSRDRYPEITGPELLQADIILLSSEPFPFGLKHIDPFQKAFPAALILPVDGEMFSWYGSRLLKAPEYFKNLMNKFYSFVPYNYSPGFPLPYP